MIKLYTQILLFLNCLTAFGFTTLPPTATISGGTTLCQNTTGSVITFTGSGGTAPYTFTYTVTGVSGNQTIVTSGTNNTVTLPIVTSVAGTFTYTLVSVSDSTTPAVVIPANGSTVVNVNTPPAVNFTFTNNNSCSGTAIQFTPTVSTPGSYTYLWDFGDGTPTSTSQNPNHSFTSLGCGTATFNVVLTVTGNGCSVTSTNSVSVKQKPDISFIDVNATSSTNQFSNCQNASLSNQTYTITVGNLSSTTCISSYSINWNTANNVIENNVTFPISHTYSQLGVYTMAITAIGINGCSSTKTYTVKNISNPAAGVLNPGGTVDMCLPTPIIQYTIGNWGQNSPGTTYSVDYGDGLTILNLSQDFMVTTPYYNAANPSLSSNYPIPYSYTTNSCPNPKFTIKLTVTNACKSTEAQVDGGNTISKTIADFSAPPVSCSTSSVLFTNTSSLGFVSGCIKETKFTWNFGDPSSGSSNIITTPFVNNNPNASHTFSAPGTYTVTLTALNACGSTTQTKTICIEPLLTPTFTLNTTNGCAPLSVTATNTTNTTNSCNTPTYLWQVTYSAGFCGTSITPIPNQTSANASFNFVESGTYLIRLTMTNSCGTFNSTQTVIVKKPPTVSIAPLTSFCGTATINPIATVTNCAPSGSTLTYAWSFPGGNPSTANTLNPGAINYPTSGSYPVSLIVTNECGASNTAMQTLVINQSPVITNTNLSQTICSGTTTTPVNLTTNPSTATFSWTATATAGISGFIPSGTTTTIPAQTISTTSNSVGTVTYVITPTIGTCTGASVSYIITVNPAAQVNQPTALFVCNGNSITPNIFSTSNTTAGTTYSWTNSNGSIGLATSGNGNIPTFTAINTTNTPIIATITVTPSFSGGSAVCNGVAKSFTITVNPTGQVNQPNNVTSCNTTAVSVNFSTLNSGGTTSYNWTNDTTSIGLPSSGTGNLNFTATNTTNAPITATITVTPTYTIGTVNCAGTSKTFTITINPSAQVNQPTAISVCNGSTIPTTNFSTQNTTGTTTFTWTNSNPSIGLAASGTGDIPSFTAINNGTAILNATIIVTPTIVIGSNSCSGTTKQFIISVLPNASLVATTNKIICNGSASTAITFSSTTTGGTTSYTWTNDNPSIGLAASGNGNIPIFTAVNTGLSPVTASISVTPTFTNGSLTCSGATQTFTITVNPSAQVNSITNIEVCNGNSIPATVFSTSNLVGTTTYSWTNSNSAIGLATSGNGPILGFTANNTTSTAITATFTVTPTFTHLGVSCTGPNKTFTIKVNPSPIATISGTVSVCLNAPNPQITFTGSSGNAPYTFTYNLNGGTSQTITTSSGNSISINAPTDTVGTFTYNLINVQDSNATSCLNSLSQSAIVTVNNAPTINAQPLPTQSICVGGTIANPLTVTFLNGTGTASYQWYSNNTNSNSGGTSISGATSSTYTPPVFNSAGTFYYYVVISFTGNGCGIVTSTVASVDVLPDPIVSNQPLPTQTLCQNETPTNLTVTATGGTGTFNYQWFSTTIATTTGGITVGTNSPIFTPPTNTVGTLYYYCAITQTGIGCSVTSNSVAVIVNPSPTIANQPISSTVCQNGTPTTLSYTYNNGVGTPTYQWFSNTTNSNTGGSLIPNETSSTFTPPSTATGTFYYYGIITFPALVGSCSSVSTNVAVITINPQSTIDLQPLPTQSICVGGTIANPLTVTFLNGTGTASYQWYSSNTNSNSGGTSISGAASATYTPPVFNSAGTFYYYVVISFTGNGCGIVTSTVASVDVLPDPIISNQPLPTQTLCQNETPTNLTVTATGGTGTFNYQWFSTTTATTTSGITVGTNSPIFTPPTNTVGTLYYYCTITQTGIGCSVTSNSAAVIVNTSPTIANQPISSTVCQNGTPTALSYTYNDGVGTPTYQWFLNTTNSNTGGSLIPNETSSTFTPPSTTTGTFYYYGVITFPALVGNCSSVSTNVAVITINPQSTIDAQPLPTQSICVGGTIANPLSATFLNGTGTASYQWYSNNTNSNSSGTSISGATTSTYTPPVFSSAGTFYYYVVISFTGNGCGNVTSAVASVDVLPDPIVSTQPIASQTLCQNAIPSLLQVTATGGIGTFTYQWFSNNTNSTIGGTLLMGETSATFSPPTLNNGTLYYYCEITQPNGIGCNVTSATSQINVNLAPAISTNPVSEIVCLGDTITPLSVDYINGVGMPIYQWYSNSSNSNVGGIAIANETNSSFSPPASTAGTFFYYCIITFPSLNGGCEMITSTAATIIINQIPVISSQNQTICSSATFTINPVTASPDIVPTGTLYTWSAPILNPIGAIIGSSAQTVGQPEISQTLVNTSSAAATATYTITPSSGNCIGATFTSTITINPAMNPNAVVTNSTCFGIDNGSITTNITGGIPFTTGAPYTIQWTGPNGFSSTNATVSNLEPGIYQLSINDAGGCPIANSYTITEPSDIILTTDSSNNITCFGSNNGSIAISVSGGTAAYSYSWTQNNMPYATTEDISNLSPATYVVTVYDVNNCGPKTATFVITEPPLLQVNLANQTNVACYGFSTGAITVNTNGGTPLQVTPGVFQYNYLWSGPNGYTSTNQNLNNLVAGIYTLVVSDNLGCTANFSVTITQPTEIVITAVTTPIVCYNDNNATITTTVSGGNPPYQIQWSNLAVGLNQNNLSPGDYTITITDALGCQKSLTINIPSPPIFDVNPVVTNISCFGANDGSIVLNFVGGIAPVNLVWSDGSPAGTVRNNLGPGTYSVIISDSKPCTISRTFTILEPQLLVLSANLTNALDCNNANSGAINLLVSGGTPPFNYVWNNGVSTEDLTNIPAGNYLVTVTDARGCIKTAQYSITRPSPIVLAVNTTTNANCATQSVLQNFEAQVSGGVPPFQFNWSTGTTSGTNNELMTTTENGLVTLTATDAIGCSAIYSFDVDLPQLGTATFSAVSIGSTSYGLYSILDPIEFQSTVSGDYISVLWDFGDGTFSNEINPTHTYLIPNEYYLVTLTVTYPFGCVYSNQLALNVEKGYVLVVPTAFTPSNNDGLNDTLRPVTRGLKNIRLDIYDTWGSLIYSEVGEVLVGWNGKIKDIPSENGNYYVKVSAETFYGTIINENQTFVLIK